MRLGKVILSYSYVVDLDNRDMVAKVKERLYEDALTYLGTITEKECSPSEQEEIPEFLKCHLFE